MHFPEPAPAAVRTPLALFTNPVIVVTATTDDTQLGRGLGPADFSGLEGYIDPLTSLHAGFRGKLSPTSSSPRPEGSPPATASTCRASKTVGEAVPATSFAK